MVARKTVGPPVRRPTRNLRGWDAMPVALNVHAPARAQWFRRPLGREGKG